jgi:Pyridine nucleotide-disulphide oxidoreductase, dimerisation domain
VTNYAETSDWYSSQRVGLKYSGYKVLVQEARGLILGAHLLGFHAEEVINLFALAIRKGLRATDLEEIPYAYPTSSSDMDNVVGGMKTDGRKIMRTNRDGFWKKISFDGRPQDQFGHITSRVGNRPYVRRAQPSQLRVRRFAAACQINCRSYTGKISATFVRGNRYRFVFGTPFTR